MAHFPTYDLSFLAFNYKLRITISSRVARQHLLLVALSSSQPRDGFPFPAGRKDLERQQVEPRLQPRPAQEPMISLFIKK